MLDDDEIQSRQPESDSRTWRSEFTFPDPEMASHFNEWWEREGWWSFRAWYEGKFRCNSEWEQFMRKIWELPSASERKPLAHSK